MKILRYLVFFAVLLCVGVLVYQASMKYFHQNEILGRIIERLKADSRVAEILVTGVNLDEKTGKPYTTIKFLEYDVEGQPLEPKYFTFSGNIIQFQSLVIRFDDIHLRNAEELKGKSAFIFWKVFLLDGENTQEYVINPIDSIPQGYKVQGLSDPMEKQLWASFWQYALDPEQGQANGIKNAQIEAPGMMFVPGHIYLLKIEHDGGLRIDTQPISPILKGEKVLM